MAKLLLEWLNELELSRPVVNIDEDFRDGFLIGELLHRHNQIEDFSLFLNKPAQHSAKINNFTLLEPVLRALGVNFSSKIFFDIINAKPGVMKTLLYELKITLDRIKKQGQQLAVNNSILLASKHGPSSSQTNAQQFPPPAKILRVIPNSKPSYDKTMSVAFENSIRTVMENPNDVMMKQTIERFQRHNQEFQSTVAMGYNLSMTAVSDELARKKEIQRHRKQHEKDFNAAYEHINTMQWVANQRVAKQRVELKQRIATQRMQKIARRQALAQTQTREHTLRSIDDFNRQLETQIVQNEDPELSRQVQAQMIKTVVGSAEAGLPTLTYVNKEYLDDGLRNAQKVMQEHSEDAAIRSQNHDQRRRKFVRERDSAHTLALSKFSETEIVERLLIWSGAEHNELALQTNTLAHQQMITQNRVNRDALIGSLQSDKAAHARTFTHTEEVARELQWQVGTSIDEQRDRAHALTRARTNARRQDCHDMCAELVDKLIDVSLFVSSCRQFGLFAIANGNSEVGDANSSSNASSESATSVAPAELWADCVRMFEQDVQVSVPLPTPIPTHAYHDVPYCYSHTPHTVDIGSNLERPFQPHSALTHAHTHRPQFYHLIESARIREATTHQAASTPRKGTPADASSATTTHISQHTDVIDQPIDEQELIAPAVTFADSRARSAQSSPRTNGAISGVLAEVEQVEFIRSIAATSANTSAAGGLDYGVCLPHQSSSASTNNEAGSSHTVPAWLTRTAPCYLLGKSVVHMRCAAEPVPDLEHFTKPVSGPHTDVDPEVLVSAHMNFYQATGTGLVSAGIPSRAVVEVAASNLHQHMLDTHLHTRVPAFPCRVCVCCVCDTARSVCVNVFKNNVLGVSIIRLEELIAQAFEAGKALFEQANASSNINSHAHPQEPQTHSRATTPFTQSHPHSSSPSGAAYRETKERTYSLKQLLQLTVYHALTRGCAVSDEMGVCLILQALLELPHVSPGFVLADFPNTRGQSVLLLQMLSGINYDSHKPQPLDRVSSFALVNGPDSGHGHHGHREHNSQDAGHMSPEAWDASLCGLDCAICVNAGDTNALLSHRMCIRNEVTHPDAQSSEALRQPRLLQESGDENQDQSSSSSIKSVVYITPEVLEGAAGSTSESAMFHSVESLQELYVPERPVHTCSVEYSIAAEHHAQVCQFWRGSGPGGHGKGGVAIGRFLSCTGLERQSSASATVDSEGTLQPTYCRTLPHLLTLESMAAQLAETFAAKLALLLKQAGEGDEDALLDDVGEGEDDQFFEGKPLSDSAAGGDAATTTAATAGEASNGPVDGDAAAMAAGGAGAGGDQGIPGDSGSVELDLDEEEALEAEAAAKRAQARLELISKCQLVTYTHNLHPSTPSLLNPPPAAKQPSAQLQSQTQSGGDGVGDEGAGAGTAPVAAVAPTEAPLPHLLGSALCALWSAAETQSSKAIHGFFDSLRCVRYQVLQRRRAVYDIIHTHTVTRDNRQTLIEQFVKTYNTDIDEDLRFDPDCKAELLLRAVELHDELWQLCDDRRAFNHTQLTQIANDGVCGLFTHRVQCDAAALLQSELSRFTQSINVILDVSKGLQSYDFTQVIANPLEECLPVPESVLAFVPGGTPTPSRAASPSLPDSKGPGGKDGGKGKDAKEKDKAKAPAKGKGAVDVNVPVPYRVPVNEVLINGEAMLALPEAVNPQAQEQADAAANAKKGKAAAPAPAKGKKGDKVEEAPPQNPFEAAEKAVLACVTPFAKDGGFTLNRMLYGNNEAVCCSVEAAVWHEVERLRQTLQTLKQALEQALTFVLSNEQSLLTLCKALIEQRFVCETSQAQCVFSLLCEHIVDCRAVSEQWLCAPDVVAVCKQQLIIPKPPPPVVPQVTVFHDNKLNAQQIDRLGVLVSSVGPAGCNTAAVSSDGAVATAVIEQDLAAVLDRCLSAVGPLAHVTQSQVETGQTNRLLGLAFPKNWRQSGNGEGFADEGQVSKASLAAAIMPQVKLAGLDEHVGVVDSAAVCEYLANVE